MTATRRTKKRTQGNVTFSCERVEIDALKAAAKKRGLALATVARALTLRYFKVKAVRRRALGPKARTQSRWKAPRKVAKVA